MPRRVRVQGDLYHGVIPEGAVYVGRAAGRGPGALPRSPYCNPFSVKDHGEDCRRLFIEYLDANPDLVARARRELAGKDLACWCKTDAPWCHADEWLRRLAEPEAPRMIRKRGILARLNLERGGISPWFLAFLEGQWLFSNECKTSPEAVDGRSVRGLLASGKVVQVGQEIRLPGWETAARCPRPSDQTTEGDW